MMHIVKLFLLAAVAACALGLAGAAQARESLDRVVAVVEDGVITESELVARLSTWKRDARRNNAKLPPDEVVVRRLLDDMVMEKIQLQLAGKYGIKIDEEAVRAREQQLAQRNNISVEEFRRSLSGEGITYADFLEQIRNQLTIEHLMLGVANSQVKVSEGEIDSYLKAKGTGGGGEPSYLLGQILIATPRAASPQEVQKAKEKAEKLVAEIKKGLDFKQAAMGSSDDAQALRGGELGWRRKSQIPSLYAELVDKMKEGDLEGPLRSSSGFHIIKMLGIKSAGGQPVTKIKARHILIKTTEVVTDEEARQKLLDLRRRIEAGEDFAELAKTYSDDKMSAIKGGELGWVQPGTMVQPFEAAMSALAPKQISEPVQTQYGWHLIQVLERQESDDSGKAERDRARQEIFARKADEEINLWRRRIRDEAYVEIRLP